MNLTLRRLGALAILVASFTVAALVIKFQPHVEHYIRSIGWTAYPIAIVVFAFVASAPFSVTDALAIMNGSIFGPLWGCVVDTIGLVFAAMLGYWINVRASHLLDLAATLKSLPPWVKRFPIASPMFLLSVRVIPGLGGTIATATAATFRIPVWVHVWTMCAIAVPICCILSIFGDRATVLVHQYESRARLYMREHRPHFHWRFHRERTPLPRVTVSP